MRQRQDACWAPPLRPGQWMPMCKPIHCPLQRPPNNNVQQRTTVHSSPKGQGRWHSLGGLGPAEPPPPAASKPGPLTPHWRPRPPPRPWLRGPSACPGSAPAPAGSAPRRGTAEGGRWWGGPGARTLCPGGGLRRGAPQTAVDHWLTAEWGGGESWECIGVWVWVDGTGWGDRGAVRGDSGMGGGGFEGDW